MTVVNKKTLHFNSGVSFDIINGVKAINVSGGADSALMLYILMSNVNETIHILTLGNSRRGRKNVRAAMNVVEKCIQLTGNHNIIHYNNYTNVQSDETLFEMCMRYKDTIDVLYAGMTMNPPLDVTQKFNLAVTEKHRNPGQKKSNYVEIPSWPEKIFYMPWVNIDKRTIASLYEELNILEELFPLTRSCEYDPMDKFFVENKTDDPGMGHCGECWWCEERQWGFGRLK